MWIVRYLKKMSVIYGTSPREMLWELIAWGILMNGVIAGICWTIEIFLHRVLPPW